ncbi:MAG: CoA-binding protein [Taibaiella sp.]|nr:CoA-binding protein [Taibaiella sp.]
MKNKTLVLGASENPARYSNMAVKKLMSKGHEVIAVGKREGQIGNLKVAALPVESDEVDTVTLYMNAAHQVAYHDYILSLNPRRIIFNPGAENIELELLAEKNGIKTMEACTLVMLSTGQY